MNRHLESMASLGPSVLGFKQLSVLLVDCMKTPAVLRVKTTEPGNYLMEQIMNALTDVVFEENVSFTVECAEV